MLGARHHFGRQALDVVHLQGESAQRVASDGTGYDGSTSVSFGGFAPADDARFTVYVVVHAPKVDGGGGSIAGPVFSRIMGYVLGRYGVEPTNGTPSRLPVEW